MVDPRECNVLTVDGRWRSKSTARKASAMLLPSVMGVKCWSISCPHWNVSDPLANDSSMMLKVHSVSQDVVRCSRK